MRIVLGTIGSARLGGVIASGVLLIAACHKSASGPTAPGSPPSSAPGNVAGVWVGTFSNDNIEFDCLVFQLPAQATFEQDGLKVRGTLSTAQDPCGLVEQTFVGTISGNQLAGKTFIGGQETSLDVRGVLLDTNLEIGFGVNLSGYPSAGQMHLHR